MRAWRCTGLGCDDEAAREQVFAIVDKGREGVVRYYEFVRVVQVRARRMSGWGRMVHLRTPCSRKSTRTPRPSPLLSRTPM